MQETSNSRGKLLIIEGPDRSGKTTQIKKIKKYIKDKNIQDKFIFTREPGGLDDPVTEKLREIILDKNNKIYPMTEAYLYAASRAQHTILIEEQLSKGMNVICDRYLPSSMVYQGIVRGLGVEEIVEINASAVSQMQTENLDEMQVAYFKISLDTYINRKRDGDTDRIESEGNEFFEKIIGGYDKVMSCIKDVVTIDANRSEEEVFADFVELFDKIFKEE